MNTAYLIVYCVRTQTLCCSIAAIDDDDDHNEAIFTRGSLFLLLLLYLFGWFFFSLGREGERKEERGMFFVTSHFTFCVLMKVQAICDECVCVRARLKSIGQFERFRKLSNVKGRDDQEVLH